ncbi:ATP-binding cassette domain-containing protein [Actinoallomurus purpureus]|uniref:ATP-binding cassette domain-containing protein n=1 Tax=Actinoallomurus purpureus TaxID=478114 RepID=UPI002092BF1B|nr:ATP-binding cassette domain-containing protein [Actinoallomurus purpureus]MCO6003905.1 ATP-binding cassette domain-containing protein [Actinoallomurus purpureus]
MPKPPEPLRFEGLFRGRGQDGTLAELHEVTVGDRLRAVSLTVATGDHLLVHGPNGAGKSTLRRVLAGEEPDSGVVRRRGRVGYLPQEVDFPDPRRSVLAVFADGRPAHPDEQRSRLISYGLFHPDALETPVGALSVGQRRRLALARLLASEHDLLLLDEPTNHLSLVLVEELEQALGTYCGALVVVSHDRTLRRRFPGARLELRAGRLTG